MTTMDKLADGIYTSNDWTITVTQGERVGVWHYRASKFSQYRSGFVQAWDEESAAQAAADELKETK